MGDLLEQGFNTNIIIAGLFALTLLYFLFRALVGPAKYVWRIFTMSLLGLIIIVGTNTLGQLVQASVPLNPFTVLLVGYLGVPGAAALIVIQLLLR
ncbi:MAG: inhibitor of the pro-sigma K processing machinery [Bacillota bacterium]|nr:MAG: inhibitor of the pro-sigma K processing machinery [Bacillota bacterium]